MYPAAAVGAEPNVFFVFLMGMGTVMIGLFCIILLCSLMSAVVRKFSGSGDKGTPETKETAPPSAPSVIPNRGELVAAISAAVAEELGEDVGAIRILSLKKID